VVFENLRHEAVDSTSNIGQKHEDVCAVVTRGQRTFNGIDLAANALYSSYKLLFFFINV
jgi:hypothetical protein